MGSARRGRGVIAGPEDVLGPVSGSKDARRLVRPVIEITRRSVWTLWPRADWPRSTNNFGKNAVLRVLSDVFIHEKVHILPSSMCQASYSLEGSVYRIQRF